MVSRPSRRRRPPLLGVLIAAGIVVAQVQGGVVVRAEAQSETLAPDRVAEYARTRASAETGNAAAQFNLGWMLYFGDGVPKNPTEAIKWIRKAAEQGNVRAEGVLAQALEFGNGIAINIKEALVWYKRAADGGSADAQWSLGRRLFLGLDIKKDTRTGLMWVRKSADQGNMVAVVGLALLLDDGEGGAPQDKRTAFAYFTRAANAGEAVAQFHLAKYYLAGDVAPRDPAAAKDWIAKAAAQGFEPAQQVQQFAMFGESRDPHGPPRDADILETARKSIKDDFLASIPKLYGNLEAIDGKGALARVMGMGTLTASQIAACNVNRPEDDQRCLSDLKARLMPERDKLLRNANDPFFATDFKYVVIDKTNYEGNYVTIVDVRKPGTDHTWRLKMLLKPAGPHWLLAEKTETDLDN